MRRLTGLTFQAPQRSVIVWSGAYMAFGFELQSNCTTKYLTPEARTAIKNAGYTGMRMPFDLGTPAVTGGASRTAILKQYRDNLVLLANDGFKQYACAGLNGVNGYDGFGIFDGYKANYADYPATSKWKRTIDCWTELAALIHAADMSQHICIEPLNEPMSPRASFPYNGGTWDQYMAQLNAAIRKAAPTTTILAGAPYQNYYPLFDGSFQKGNQFVDTNMGVAYHYYPEPYAQQGLGDTNPGNNGWHGGITRLPIPPPASKAECDVVEAANRAWMTKIGTPRHNQNDIMFWIHNYLTYQKNITAVNADIMNKINAWASKNGLTGKVFCTEWGICGDEPLAKPNPIKGADKTSRIYAYAMHSRGFDAAGHPHVVQQLFRGRNGGDGKDYAQSQALTTSYSPFTMDQELVDAVMGT